MDTNNYILDLLKLINQLQKNTIQSDSNDCAKPFLGTNNNLAYNTRPFSLYLCNNTPLTITYSTGESNIFRVEKINGDCVTVRLLAQGEDDSLTATNEYATININCIAAISCLYDVSLTL